MKKINGYRKTNRNFLISGEKRDRRAFFLGRKDIDIHSNFQKILDECTNIETAPVFFESSLLTKYKKQEQLLAEKKVLTAVENTIIENTIVECVIQLIEKGIVSYLIVGCVDGYMVEMHPTSDKKIYVFARKYAEWQYYPKEKKKYVLSIKEER